MLWAKLGDRYPAALDALRERRDRVRERLFKSENDYQAAMELGSINRAFKVPDFLRLGKPFSVDEFFAALRQALGESKITPQQRAMLGAGGRLSAVPPA